MSSNRNSKIVTMRSNMRPSTHPFSGNSGAHPAPNYHSSLFVESIRPPPPGTREAGWRSLVNNPSHSDICFEVDGKVIRGHKAVLAAQSNYFATMFAANMSEATRDVPVVVEDVPYDTFLQVMSYIYTGDVSIALHTTSTHDEYRYVYCQRQVPVGPPQGAL
jgi:BTB/POZ domain